MENRQILGRGKDMIRSVLHLLHLDLTQNLRYDRLTKAIMKKVIRPGMNCIDVGCHKGEMLSQMLRLAPGGKHYAFEPIPVYYGMLKRQFSGKAIIYPYALSDHEGCSTFCLVKNAPAYSGLKRRRYDNKQPQIEQIQVQVKKLDEVLPKDVPVHFIKIDVEGGEYDVMKGGRGLLKRCQPVVIFESGVSAGDHYGTRPGQIYQLLTREAGLKISTLAAFLKGAAALSPEEFTDFYFSEKEYYFIAHP